MAQRSDQHSDRRHTREATQPRQILTLTLQPEPAPTNDNRVTWDPNVTENVQQRVSKCCCVFHKKRVFGESDSDTSSSDSSSSDSDSNHHRRPQRVRKLGDGDDAEHSEVEGSTSNCCSDDHHHHHDSDIKKKHRRPKCTKESCLCGTRFS